MYGETILPHMLRPIQHLLDDPMVTEIVIQRPYEVGVERASRWEWLHVKEFDPRTLDAIGIVAGFLLSKPFDPEHPVCMTTLPGGQRATFVRAPIVKTQSITIRIPSKTQSSVDDPRFQQAFREPMTAADEDAELLRLYRAGDDMPAFFRLAVRRKKNIAAIGETGHGKAQPLDAKVLTPTGFRLMGSLSVGDLLTCPDGRTAPITGLFPQGEKEIYRVTFSDGRAVECCDDHLWKVWECNTPYETGKSHGTRLRLDGGARWTVASLSDIRSNKRRWKRAAVPLVDPYAIEYPSQDLSIPPYALGVLLGDGSFQAGKVCISSADQEIVARLREDMPAYDVTFRLGYDYDLKMKDYVPVGRRDRSVDRSADKSSGWQRKMSILYGGRRQPISAWARETGVAASTIYQRYTKQGWTSAETLGFDPAPKASRAYSPLGIALRSFGLWGLGSHEKFVPEIYKRGSVSQRIAILQGLMDTDGSVGRPGTHATFTSTSEQLARDVQEISWSLGAVAKIGLRQTYFTYRGERKAGRPSWRVSIVHPDIATMFSLPRKLAQCAKKGMRHRLKIVAIERIGKKQAQCISVAHPDHLYVTDNYVVTHNTFMLRTVMGEIPDYERLVTIEDTSEFGPLHLRNRVEMTFGSAGITAADLVEVSLRQRPDRVALQELRGREIWAYMRILAAGYRGSFTSWHAPREAPFEPLVLMAKQTSEGQSMDAHDLEAAFRRNIDVVVHCHKNTSTNTYSNEIVWFGGETAQ